MLDALYFVPDIMDRYRCGSKDTARRYMREMGAKGSPLFVTEDMIRVWERSKRKAEEAGPSVGIHKAIPVGMKIPRRK